MRILFVCQHNVARSKVAELFCSNVFPGLEFHSAGMEPDQQIVEIPRIVSQYFSSNWKSSKINFGKSIKEMKLEDFNKIIVSNHKYFLQLKNQCTNDNTRIDIYCTCRTCAGSQAIFPYRESIPKILELAIAEFLFVATQILLKTCPMERFIGLNRIIAPLNAMTEEQYSKITDGLDGEHSVNKFLNLDWGHRESTGTDSPILNKIFHTSEILLPNTYESIYPMKDLLEFLHLQSHPNSEIVGINSPLFSKIGKLDFAAMLRVSIGKVVIPA